MRVRLFWKLFALQMLAAAAILAGALTITRVYSVRGFTEHLAESERERVQQLAGDLADAYADSGDLVSAAESMRALQAPRRQAAPPDRGPDADAHEGGRRHWIVRRHRGGRHLPPLQLQDADGAYLMGDPRPERIERFREPITVDGRTVGYLAWPRFVPHPEQTEFARKQARHHAIIAPVALVVAALCAALITALIVRPIRQLSVGAAALARREFGTRLPAQRRDELGQLAQDFNRLAEALQGYDARQRQWLADIAHELRTPLATLRGEIEAVLDGVRAAGPELLRSLHEEVGRLAALVGDLQLVSLAESGGLRLSRVETDVAELARQSAARFQERFKSKGFELRLAVEAGAQAMVDAQRLEQVLANLLENALRHAAPPGPVTLSVWVEPADIVLSVADAGPGVPAEVLPRLFDRLYRAESARTRAAGGAGLGLSICKSIVEAHGGSIAARAAQTGGLEIELRLPREAA